MKTSTVLALCSSTTLVVALSGNACAGEWPDQLASTVRDTAATVNKTNEAVNSINQGVQVLQSGPQMLGAAKAAKAATAESLTGLLMQRLNVSQAQADGGAGALFQVAKSRMKEESFNQLSQAVPGMQNLLNAAPAMAQEPAGLGGLVEGVSAMTGVPSDTITSLGSLVGSFQQLDMSGDMVQQFVPVVVDYVRTSSGDSLANALMLALSGS